MFLRGGSGGACGACGSGGGSCSRRSWRTCGGSCGVSCGTGGGSCGACGACGGAGGGSCRMCEEDSGGGLGGLGVGPFVMYRLTLELPTKLSDAQRRRFGPRRVVHDAGAQTDTEDETCSGRCRGRPVRSCLPSRISSEGTRRVGSEGTSGAAYWEKRLVGGEGVLAIRQDPPGR
ncbi:hypothetical protein T492DRAFT_893642 [Pavlovales sp. CCMP2436]|nr:hypothetical protein T492DRAFT_893642 [Pavlovales sp. CCMP2436]